MRLAQSERRSLTSIPKTVARLGEAHLPSWHEPNTRFTPPQRAIRLDRRARRGVLTRSNRLADVLITNRLILESPDGAVAEE